MENLPSPLEILFHPITLMVVGMFICLYLWETFFPRQKNLPKIKYATLRGLLAFGFLLLLSTYLPILTDEFLASFQLIDISNWPVWSQVITGLLFYQFLLYLWHRYMHKSDLLWRVFHQMHHSSERMDVPSTFYLSPMDMIGFTLLGSLCFALIMGLSPLAITIVILALNFLSIFQHANISTPQWLGYFIQRPEQHAVHHQRGVHKYNYSDFPIYDYFFGTFKNPSDFQDENGFFDGGSARVMDMILFKDINK